MIGLNKDLENVIKYKILDLILKYFIILLYVLLVIIDWVE